MWEEEKSDTQGAAKSVTDIFTTFWHLLWSITVQTLGNMESVFFL